MNDFLMRLAERTLGLAAPVQPVLAPRYAPGDGPADAVPAPANAWREQTGERDADGAPGSGSAAIAPATPAIGSDAGPASKQTPVPAQPRTAAQSDQQERLVAEEEPTGTAAPAWSGVVEVEGAERRESQPARRPPAVPTGLVTAPLAPLDSGRASTPLGREPAAGPSPSREDQPDSLVPPSAPMAPNTDRGQPPRRSTADRSAPEPPPRAGPVAAPLAETESLASSSFRAVPNQPGPPWGDGAGRVEEATFEADGWRSSNAGPASRGERAHGEVDRSSRTASEPPLGREVDPRFAREAGAEPATAAPLARRSWPLVPGEDDWSRRPTSAPGRDTAASVSGRAAARSSAVEAREAGAAPPRPIVEVTIGRIEVRAVQPPAPPPASPPVAGPRLSLEEYLRARSGGLT